MLNLHRDVRIYHQTPIQTSHNFDMKIQMDYVIFTDIGIQLKGWANNKNNNYMKINHCDIRGEGKKGL